MLFFQGSLRRLVWLAQSGWKWGCQVSVPTWPSSGHHEKRGVGKRNIWCFIPHLVCIKHISTVIHLHTNTRRRPHTHTHIHMQALAYLQCWQSDMLTDAPSDTCRQLLFGELCPCFYVSDHTVIVHSYLKTLSGKESLNNYLKYNVQRTLFLCTFVLVDLHCILSKRDRNTTMTFILGN